MKLVLDYIYSGAMYLCGAHMQYVIQVVPYLPTKKYLQTNHHPGDGGVAAEVWGVGEQDGEGV